MIRTAPQWLDNLVESEINRCYSALGDNLFQLMSVYHSITDPLPIYGPPHFQNQMYLYCKFLTTISLAKISCCEFKLLLVITENSQILRILCQRLLAKTGWIILAKSDSWFVVDLQIIRGGLLNRNIGRSYQRINIITFWLLIKLGNTRFDLCWRNLLCNTWFARVHSSIFAR